MRKLNHTLKRGIQKTLKGLALAPVRISLALILFSVFICGGIYSLAEDNASWVDGMYWATVVLPTVGFGDFSPATTVGRATYIWVAASGWIATILMGGAVVDAIREHTIQQQHYEQTAEFDDDFDNLDAKVDELKACIAKLRALADNDHVREGARKAHTERNKDA